MQKLIISARNGYRDQPKIELMIPDALVEGMKNLALDPQNASVHFAWPNLLMLRYVGSNNLSESGPAVNALRNVTGMSLSEALDFIENKEGETFPVVYGAERIDTLPSSFERVGLLVKAIPSEELLEEHKIY